MNTAVRFNGNRPKNPASQYRRRSHVSGWGTPSNRRTGIVRQRNGNHISMQEDRSRQPDPLLLILSLIVVFGLCSVVLIARMHWDRITGSPPPAFKAVEVPATARAAMNPAAFQPGYEDPNIKDTWHAYAGQ